MNKRGLGRGLGALIPGAEEESSAIEIALDRIVPNPHQPRRNFDQQALEELAQSIAQHGLLQPIVLRPWQGDYQLVAGERRFRAAKLAGFSTIPAVILSSAIAKWRKSLLWRTSAGRSESNRRGRSI